MRFGRVRGTARRGPAWFDRLTMHGKVAGLVALAAGLVLALTVTPGCGSDCPTPEQRAYLNEGEAWADRSETGMTDLQTMLFEGGGLRS